jgi:uncharacterized protein (DUF302 family)
VVGARYPHADSEDSLTTDVVLELHTYATPNKSEERMNPGPIPFGMSTLVDLPYERAVERIRDALAKEGFGVLTEIDVQATFRKKLGVDFRPYVILGACNPSLAHRALTAEPAIGLLLPCNVVVYAAGAEGQSVVAAVDPEMSLGRVGNDALLPVASEVKTRLQRALDSVSV